MKNGIIGWAKDFANKMDRRMKKSLGKKLVKTNSQYPKTIALFLEEFLNNLKNNENIVIWYKPLLQYVLIVSKDEVRLSKNYKEVIVRGTRWPDNKITFQHYVGEGLEVIKELFSEMLKVEESELLSL
ncbi:MAG: hypothetical protein AAB477_03325 [Patescibacteria group bacterium]